MENKEYTNYENEMCPKHNVVGKFVPPPEIDKKRGKLIVTFSCPHGHDFTKEFALK